MTARIYVYGLQNYDNGNSIDIPFAMLEIRYIHFYTQIYHPNRLYDRVF